jgi:hypothetical protein
MGYILHYLKFAFKIQIFHETISPFTSIHLFKLNTFFNIVRTIRLLRPYGEIQKLWEQVIIYSSMWIWLVVKPH